MRNANVLAPRNGSPDDAGIDWSGCELAALFPRIENQFCGAADKRRAEVSKRVREYQQRYYGRQPS